jgi:hypothetical protein
MTKLEVDSLACGFRGYTDLGLCAEEFLGAFPFMRVHPAVNLTGRVAPSLKMVSDIVEGVPVFGKKEKLSSTIFQLRELGSLKAIPQGSQFGVAGLFSHPMGLLYQVFEGGHFAPKLVNFDGRSVLINELIASPLIEVILILFRIRQSALNCLQSSGRLG